MVNKSTLLEKLVTGVILTVGIASYLPIPFTWFGFKEVKYNNVLYTVRIDKDNTIIINNPGGGLFLEYRIDEDNNGILDHHYFRSTIPSPKQGWIQFSKAVTEEDQKIYEGINGKQL